MVNILTTGYMASQAKSSNNLRERYRDVLRRTILDAAREAFVRDGYEGVSMRRLAEKIGCSHANLYLHFEDKEALFDCLVEESFDQFAEGLRRAFQSARGGDPVQLVRKAGRAYVEFGLANPSVYEFAFLMRRPARKPDKPHVAYERLQSLVRRCMEEKRFRRMDVDAASQALWAAAHGITSLLILRPAFPWADRDKLIGRVIDAAVNDLLA
jgi:AcrR family transcriptional regulator